MDIKTLQAVRWPRSGHMSITNSVVFYGGDTQNAQQFGVGFLIKKPLLESVLKFEAIKQLTNASSILWKLSTPVLTVSSCTN